MVSLFDKENKMNNNCNKSMSINHQEFLSRIKKSLYYGPSNPNRMTSLPLASHVSKIFNETHRNYSLNTLDMDAISRVRQQTPCSMILTLIYLERLNKLDPVFLRTVSPSELFLVTLMVSTKFYSDYDEMEVFASAWAEEGRIDIERLKQLEISFLNAIQWKILVSQNEFYEKLKTVERLLAMKEGLSRGWFTYTELEMMLPTIEIAKRILNYTTIIMFSYACSIATIALSSIILASIPTTIDLATPNTNISTITTITFVPEFDATISTDERVAFDELLNQFDDTTAEIFHHNITKSMIDFKLFDRVNNWETRKSYRDIPNYQLAPYKPVPVPHPW